MKNVKLNLSKQLIIITSLSFMIMIISLIIVLPQSLEPFFEETVYSYLDQPLEMFDAGHNPNRKFKNIAYIQYNDSEVYISSNYKDILKVDDYEVLLNHIDENHGKFTYKGRTYYYSVTNKGYNKKIAITTDSYIKILRNSMLVIAIPVVVITFLIILILLLLWSNMLVVKIEKLKLKIDNMTDPNFSVVKNKLEIDDELKLLDDTIDRMKELILSNEKYRREMYQNISHDFKTPIMVVKSYSEAYHDGIESADTVINVSEEQMKKLENKVKTLLEFNKITYLQNSYKNDKKLEVLQIINSCVSKYKKINKNLSIIVKRDKKKVLFNGTEDIWESITNNLLSNAIRYANKEIIITIKEDKIIFFNDGENIEEDILKDIFLPYKKGVKGENGLGLSIVKGNCELLKYKIIAKNKKNGVEFIISK